MSSTASTQSKKTSAFISVKYIVPAIVLIAFSLLTLARNYNWFDETLMWSEVALTSPSKARAHSRLAVSYYKDGDYERAFLAASRANGIYNFYPDAHYVLGLIYWRQGENEKAAEELRWASMLVERFTDDIGYASDIHNALGRAYGDGDNFALAIKEFERALELDPKHPQAKANIELIKRVASEKNFLSAP